jgi:hypothetical protein
MYLAVNEAASLSSGIPLYAGEKFFLNNLDILNVAFNGICTSGGKTLAVFELYQDSL